MKTALITRVRRWKFYDKKMKKHYTRYIIVLPPETGELFEGKKVIITIEDIDKEEMKNENNKGF